MVHQLQHPMFRRFYVVVWVAFMSVTLLQSSGRPVVGPPAPPGPPSDSRELFLTTGHIIGFSLMLALLWWALRPAPRALLVALITCWIFGGVTEVLQRLVPDRESTFGDFFVDCLVSGLVALVIYSWDRFSGVIHRL